MFAALPAGIHSQLIAAFACRSSTGDIASSEEALLKLILRDVNAFHVRDC